MRQEDETQRRHGLAPPALLSRRPLSRALVCAPTLCVHPVPLTLSRSGPPPGPPAFPRKCLLVAPRARWGVSAGVWGDDAPSVRKPSLAIREGALGYRTPQPPPLLWKRVRSAAPVFVRSGPSRAGFERPSGDAAVPYCGPRLPPPSRGRVPPGRGRSPSRGSAALRERARARCRARIRARGRGNPLPLRCRKGFGGGGRGGLPPSPGVPAPAPRAALRPHPPHGFAADGCAVLRGHGRGPACPRGGAPPGTRVPVRVGPGRCERMGGRRGSRGGSPMVAEGVARVTFPRWPRASGGRRLRGGALGRIGRGVPGVSRGRPCVSVAVGSPRLFTRRPVSRSGALPRCPPSAVRAREQEGTVGPLARGGRRRWPRPGGRRWGPEPRPARLVEGCFRREASRRFPGLRGTVPLGGPGGALPGGETPRLSRCGEPARFPALVVFLLPFFLAERDVGPQLTSPGWPRSPRSARPCRRRRAFLPPPPPRLAARGGGRLVSFRVPPCPSRPPSPTPSRGPRPRSRVAPPPGPPPLPLRARRRRPPLRRRCVWAREGPVSRRAAPFGRACPSGDRVPASRRDSRPRAAPGRGPRAPARGRPSSVRARVPASRRSCPGATSRAARARHRVRPRRGTAPRARAPPRRRRVAPRPRPRVAGAVRPPRRRREAARRRAGVGAVPRARAHAPPPPPLPLRPRLRTPFPHARTLASRSPSSSRARHVRPAPGDAPRRRGLPAPRALLPG